MRLRWAIILTVLATVASAGIALLVSDGNPFGVLAGIPTLGVGLWQSWRGNQRATALERDVTYLASRLRPLTDPTPFERVVADDKRRHDDATARRAAGPEGTL